VISLVPWDEESVTEPNGQSLSLSLSRPSRRAKKDRATCAGEEGGIGLRERVN
jgi:hypothetical protein